MFLFVKAFIRRFFFVDFFLADFKNRYLHFIPD